MRSVDPEEEFIVQEEGKTSRLTSRYKGAKLINPGERGQVMNTSWRNSQKQTYKRKGRRH